MATSYTPLLGLALPVQGELSGTWGTTVNDNITSYLDAAVAGTQTLSTDADVTLTKTTGTALGSTSSQYAIINCTGSRAAQRTITVPAASKIYVVINATTGSQSIKIVGSGPTTGVTVANGTTAFVVWNGSDFAPVSVVANTTGVAPVAHGGTGAATFTSGGLLRGNGTGALSVASASDIVTAIGATAVTNATNLAGGANGSIPYQTGSGATSLLAAGTSGSVLQTNGAAAPSWTAQSALSVGSATSATTSTTQAAKDSTTNIATTAFVDRLRSLLSSAVTSGAISITDRGCLVAATGGVTIPNSVFAANDVVTIYNNSASSITITATITTLRLAGTATTGNRTLAQRGLATVTFISGTEAVINGAGLS